MFDSPYDRLKSDLNGRLRYLRSEDAATLVTVGANAAQSVDWYAKMQHFTSWKTTFDPGYAEVLAQAEAAGSKYLAKWESAAGDETELAKIADNARDFGADRRWVVERFLANSEAPAGYGRLGYHRMVEGRDEYHAYSETELIKIRLGEKPSVDGDTLHAHHVNSVSDAFQRGSEGLKSMYDPNNLRLMTKDAHLNSTEMGHGGSWRSPTSGRAEETDVGADLVVKGQYDYARDQVDSVLAMAALGAGVAYGVIHCILEFRTLQQDPRPWKAKARIVAATFALRGAEGASITAVTLLARNSSEVWLDDSAIDLAGILGHGANAAVLEDLIASGFGISSALAIREGLRFASDLVEGRNPVYAAKEHGSAVLVVFLEQGGFSLLGVFLDVVTPIPEPTLATLVTAARVIWVIGSLGANFVLDQKCASECARARMRAQHEITISLLRQADRSVLSL